MITDLFWDAVTSDLSILTMASLGAAGYLVGHIPFLASLPAVAPYVVLARVVFVIAGPATFTAIGYRVADERADLRDARAELAHKQIELEHQSETAADAKRLADEATERANALQDKADQYADELAKRAQPLPAVCTLNPDSIARMRQLWTSQGLQRRNRARLRKPG